MIFIMVCVANVEETLFCVCVCVFASMQQPGDEESVPQNFVDGKTAFKRRLLRALGLCIVDVPFFEWNRLQKSERAAWLEMRIDEAAADRSCSK